MVINTWSEILAMRRPIGSLRYESLIPEQTNEKRGRGESYSVPLNVIQMKITKHGSTKEVKRHSRTVVRDKQTCF
jgi:hypothetical protein